MEDNISKIKTRVAAMSKSFPDKNGMSAVEDKRPVSFFVLLIPGRDYSSVCERIRGMERRGVPEQPTIPKLRAPLKVAMNTLVRGEEIQKVFLAPMTAGQEIIRNWETLLNEDVINIFDTLASHAFTVLRSKQDRKTQYNVDSDLTPEPIVRGSDVEERIAKILKSAANMDERFKLPNVL